MRSTPMTDHINSAIRQARSDGNKGVRSLNQLSNQKITELINADTHEVYSQRYDHKIVKGHSECLLLRKKSKI